MSLTPSVDHNGRNVAACGLTSNKTCQVGLPLQTVQITETFHPSIRNDLQTSRNVCVNNSSFSTQFAANVPLSDKQRREQISIRDTLTLKDQKLPKNFDHKFDPCPCQVKGTLKND